MVTVVASVIDSDDRCFNLCPPFRESIFPPMLGPKQSVRLEPSRTHLILRPWFCKRQGKSQEVKINLPDPRSPSFGFAHSSSRTAATQMISLNVKVHQPPSFLENPSVLPIIVFAHVDVWQPVPPAHHTTRILQYVDDLHSLGLLHPIIFVLLERSSTAVDVMTQASIKNFLQALKDAGHINGRNRWTYLANEQIAWTREAVRSLLLLFGTSEAKGLIPLKSSDSKYLYSWPADRIGSSNEWDDEWDDEWDANEDIVNAKASQPDSSTVTFSGLIFTGLFVASAIGVLFVVNVASNKHEKTRRNNVDATDEEINVPSEMSGLLQTHVWPVEPQISVPCDEDATLLSWPFARVLEPQVSIPCDEDNTLPMWPSMPKGFLREDSRTFRGGVLPCK